MNVKRYEGGRWASGTSHKSFESSEIPTLLQLMYICSFLYIYIYIYYKQVYIYLYKMLNIVVVLYKRFPADVVWLPDTRFTQPFSQLFNVNFPLTINSLGNSVTIRLLTFTILRSLLLVWLTMIYHTVPLNLITVPQI